MLQFHHTRSSVVWRSDKSTSSTLLWVPYFFGGRSGTFVSTAEGWPCARHTKIKGAIGTGISRLARWGVGGWQFLDPTYVFVRCQWGQLFVRESYPAGSTLLTKRFTCWIQLPVTSYLCLFRPGSASAGTWTLLVFILQVRGQNNQSQKGWTRNQSVPWHRRAQRFGEIRSIFCLRHSTSD